MGTGTTATSGRRVVLQGLLALAVAAGLAVTGAPASASSPAPAASRPNVFFYNLDDLRDKVPGGIDPLTFMPKLRSWMAAGRRFDQHFVVDPACCPSRASMMTGRFPHNEGVEHQGDGPLFDHAHAMQAYLQQAGYSTYLVGKFLTTWPRTILPPNFTHSTVMWGGYWNVAARVDGVAKTLPGYSTTALGVRGRDYVQQALTAGKPFYLYEAPQAPHVVTITRPDGSTIDLAQPDNEFANAPVVNCIGAGEPDNRDKPPWVRWWQVSPTYSQQVCTSQIRAIMSADKQFDLTMQLLRDKGVLDNTLVIFSSDNGYFWQEHNRTSKFGPYEPSIRVPLLVRWPGHVAAGNDSTRLASYLDIAPTVLAATGTAVPAGAPPLDGQSLLVPSLRTAVLGEYWLDPANGAMSTWRMVRTATTKYIETYDTAGRVTFREYYDLLTDSTELTNLLGDGTTANDPPASVVAAQAALLSALSVCRGQSCLR